MLELLRKRRSIRKFKKDPIDQATIDELKEAVLRSPSSRNNRPWKFFFVQDAGVIARLVPLQGKRIGLPERRSSCGGGLRR